MKRIAALFAAAALITILAATAGAQSMADAGGKNSCFQVPGSTPSTSAPAVSTFQFSSLGWDLFMSEHANRLILAMSRWQTPPARIAPARVRPASAGNRAAR